MASTTNPTHLSFTPHHSVRHIVLVLYMATINPPALAFRAGPFSRRWLLESAQPAAEPTPEIAPQPGSQASPPICDYLPVYHPPPCSEAMASGDDPSIPSPDGACHFFRLPAELRNYIYEFALAEPDGVYFLIDTETKCRFENGVFCEYVSTNRFGLYPELRPALEEGNVYVCAETGLEVQDGGKAIEANQLQYVCKQMRLETEGTVAKVNDVKFRSGDTAGQFATACAQLLRLSSNHKPLCENFTSITIESPPYGPYWSLSSHRPASLVPAEFRTCDPDSIFHFCQQYPTVKVRIELRGLCGENPRRLLMICWVLNTIRGKDLPWRGLVDATEMVYDDLEVWNLPNLRFVSPEPVVSLEKELEMFHEEYVSGEDLLTWEREVLNYRANGL